MKLLRTLQSNAPKALVLWLVTPLLGAQGMENEARPDLGHHNLGKAALALEGYDATSYFAANGEPMKGDAKHHVNHRGITYRFANAKNKEAFLANPERFEPAYGGWCAYAMSKGEQVEVDPESFLIEDGRLLLFYKGFLNDTRKKWTKEGAKTLRPLADGNWTKIRSQAPPRDVSEFNISHRGLALAGYDPVSYLNGKPHAGERAITATYRDVSYRFADEAAKAEFEGNPESFEPAYGGWCAWAMAQGKKVRVDPEAFVRDESGLYLFYNGAKRDEWIASRASLTADADEHWARLIAPN